MQQTVIAIGELLVEIMRDRRDVPLDYPGVFQGPFPSGAPAIFIHAAARLGLPTAFIGLAGADAFGDLLLRRFAETGVDTRCVHRLSTHTTGAAFVAYRSDGSRNFVFHLDHAACGQLSEAHVDPAFFEGAAWLHVTGSTISANEGSRRACYKAVREAVHRGARVSFDPNVRPELGTIDTIRPLCDPVLSNAAVVFPNAEEATLLTGIDDPDRACTTLGKITEAPVVLKVGKNGCRVYYRHERIEVPGFPVEEVDPTGAGDNFAAGFVYGMLAGWEWETCARLANAVGALSVTRLGPMEGAPTLEDARRLAGL